MSRITYIFALIMLTAAPAMAQQVGYASWYNRGFQGLSTASGEAYDHEAMTAAHPELPFGTVLRVTRVDDGRSVLVTVNDRMVSGPGHVVDLSGAAARELGMLDTGVARVRLEPTQRQAATTSPEVTATITQPQVSTTEPAGNYTLQLGVFSSRPAAQEMAGRLEGAWIKSIATETGTMYRVYYRSFEAETSARSAQTQLFNAGFESFLRSL